MAVTVQDTDSESADLFGIPTGAYIVSVEKDGAADRAGSKCSSAALGRRTPSQ